MHTTKEASHQLCNKPEKCCSDETDIEAKSILSEDNMKALNQDARPSIAHIVSYFRTKFMTRFLLIACLAISVPFNISIVGKSMTKFAAADPPVSSPIVRLDAQNATQSHKTSWCPYATCNDSPVCSPCKRRFLFIVASGRSGSTTLLSMMNMLPNVRLSGENNNELFVISGLETNLRRDKKKHILHEPAQTGPWKHNQIPDQALSCPMQKVVETLDIAPNEVLENIHQEPFRSEEEGKILGVKTIRIQQGNWGPKKAADFFKRNFPCSRIIVNYRSDSEAQLNSTSNLGWRSVTEDSLIKTNHFLEAFANNLGDDMSKIIDMTEWSKDVSVINNVVDWLGFEHCHFKSLMHENHGGFGRDSSDNLLSEKCRFENSFIIPKSSEIVQNENTEIKK